MIKKYGKIEIPQEIIKNADTIKYENYKTNTPTMVAVKKGEIK